MLLVPANRQRCIRFEDKIFLSTQEPKILRPLTIVSCSVSSLRSIILNAGCGSIIRWPEWDDPTVIAAAMALRQNEKKC